MTQYLSTKVTFKQLEQINKDSIQRGYERCINFDVFSDLHKEATENTLVDLDTLVFSEDGVVTCQVLTDLDLWTTLDIEYFKWGELTEKNLTKVCYR